MTVLVISSRKIFFSERGLHSIQKSGNKCGFAASFITATVRAYILLQFYTRDKR